MSGDDVRIDVRDSEDNIHEIFIMSNGELIIWSMDKNGKTTHKSYGILSPWEIWHRGIEMQKLGTNLMKFDDKEKNEIL
ncbi:MAG: hypothetical protein WA061_01890 [Microgenomates group bacterium]